MANWYDTRSTFTELGDTVVVGRPAFVASFYSDPGLAAQAQTILNSWLALVPPKTPLWFSHEDTKRYMKLTSKALAKIHNDYAQKSLEKKYASYFIKSAPQDGPVDECHAYSFEMHAAAGYSGYVFVTFPLDYVAKESADAVIQWFGARCVRFEFTHAGAGFGYELAWFGEQARCAGPTMLSTALRFHGVRAWERESARFREKNKTTLDTAAWLTYLDATSIADIGDGAIKEIDPRVTQYRIGSGILLRAGIMPDPCDSNRRDDAYVLLKSVNDAIVPIRTTRWHQNGWATYADPEKENRWFSRMDT